MPRSNSQTSPLRGGILVLIQERDQRAASFSNLFVSDRTRIKRQLPRPAQNLYRERLLVAGREGLEGVEEFDSLLAHIFMLAVFSIGAIVLCHRENYRGSLVMIAAMYSVCNRPLSGGIGHV